MATHDYVIANQSGAAFRTDLNNALAAIVSNNSNSSSPSTTYAYQWWADTSNNVLKIRNSANNAWIELLQLDGTLTLEDGSASTPALAFRDDLNTGIFSSAADTFDIATGGAVRLQLDSSGNVKIPSDSKELQLGASGDFRLFHDGSSNRIIAQNAELLVQCNSYTIRSENGSSTYATINTSGFLGVGTSSPTVRLHCDAGTTVGNAAAFFENDDNTAYSSSAEGHFNTPLILKSTTTTGETSQSVGIQFSLSLSGQTGSIQEIGAVRTGSGAGALVFRTRNASEGRREKMRIKSDGTVCIATTSSTVNSSAFGIVLGSDGSGGFFKNAGGTADVFRAGGNAGLAIIFGDGDITNTNNSYGQASDETLKQDIVDAASQWNDIKNLRVRKFRFKANPTGVLQIGVVAQEIETVSAGLVQENEEGIKSVKYSVLYMKAVKCLQEAMAKIEVLETKVAALEAA